MKLLSKLKKYLLLSAVAAMACGCAGTANNGGNASSGDSSKAQSPQGLDPSRSALLKVNNRLFNVPSPMQLATMLKGFGQPYHKEILSDVGKRGDYTTTFKQALNVGVYGADLGYINAFDQLPDATAYFGAVRTLTTELGVLNTFNEQTMQRIERNSGDKDSLLYIASMVYRESDAYLMNSERNEVGALIIAGGWVEGLYLLTHICTVDQMTDNHFQIIGQQKHPLNNLIELLRPYYGSVGRDYDSFLEKLSEIANIYDAINVKYTYKPAETDEEGKITVINSESQVMIEKQHVVAIADRVARLRADITR
ncbi:MAG: hypothetical protein IKP73_00480 [Bacteroidales bacterium]|jgi:hypothetical protein|nr:hypothetical protein [Bacteroidales bacterium]